MPWDDIMGVKRETAEWLLGGVERNEVAKQEWSKYVNTFKTRSQYLFGGPLYVIANRSLYLFDDDGKFLRCEVHTSGMEDMFSILPTEKILGWCAQGHSFFVIEDTGKMFKLAIGDTSADVRMRFNEALKVVWRQFAPEQLQGARVAQFQTTDGNIFWFLTQQGSLYCLQSETGYMQEVLCNVRYMSQIDNSIVCLHGTCVKLISFKEGPYARILRDNVDVLRVEKHQMTYATTGENVLLAKTRSGWRT